MDGDTFRTLGHRLVDQVAAFLESVPRRPVNTDEAPSAVRQALDLEGALPEHGTDPGPLLERTAELLFDHSLLNGHPRFFGYITASPAPIGMLADFLAAAVNPNVGAWTLSPAATEIERQTVRWIAELIGYTPECGGLLVSGGNMANIVCFLAARAAKAGWNVREQGMAGGEGRRLRVYGSQETHTWIQKAADLTGLGTASIRWIPAGGDLRMDVAALRRTIEADIAAGDVPFMVVGTAGSVSTGAVDPLADIAAVCREHGVWFHVDGAYGGFAAAVPEAPALLRGLAEADSVAVDPHKWLYSPLEAGCALVRDAGTAARRVRLPSAVLPLRRDGDELRGPRAAELARVPRAQGVARAPPGGRRRVPADDRGRHAPVARDGRRRRPASGASARDAGTEHHDVPVRPRRPPGENRRGRGRAAPRRPQPRAARPHAAGRRRVRVECRHPAAATCSAPAS